MMECIVKEHTPVSLTFSHGDLLPEQADTACLDMLSEITRPHKVAKVVVKNNNDCLYVGNSDDSDLCNNFVAIRNKRTNSVRFYPVNNFFMCPYLGKEEQQVISQKETKSARESLIDLNKLLGSKKVKKSLSAFEKNKANLADVETTLMDSTEADDDGISESGTLLSLTPSTDYLPPCNRHASKVDEAYKIHDLISEEVLQSLESTAKEIMNMDLFVLASDSRFSPFIMKALSHVPKDLQKYKILLFVDRLLAFGRVSRRLSDKSNTFCSFSSTVHEKLIEDFSVEGLGGRRIRTTIMRDKILCYAMVLIMMCRGYEIDIGMLAGIVSPLEHQRLPALLKALGAVSTRSSPSIFKLKVPIGHVAVAKVRPTMKRR